MDEDRVMTKNPRADRLGTRISTRYYEAVRDAILGAVAESPDGVLFRDLRAEVEARTDPALWKSSSVGWYTTTVKLDLEARSLIERSGAPQRLTITDAGRRAVAD